MARGYKTAHDAAAAALARARPLSHRNEYAGVIYRQDDRYRFSDPKTSGKRDRVNIQATYPAGAEPVALYHTHPPGGRERADLFSPGDVRIMERTGLPYYMGVVETGEPRVLSPGAVSMRERRRASTARGDPVLAEIPMDEIRAHLMRKLFDRPPDDPRGLRRELP